MAKSKGIKGNKSGLLWCNIILSTQKYKIVIAEEINPDPKIFRVWSNSSVVKDEPGWKVSDVKKGWLFKDMFEEDINKFFDYTH